ncbi:oxidoreductase [Thozetella sp. PMI_491]|nr:oxidoreductase [Thozetella sp. PMI_491]
MPSVTVPQAALPIFDFSRFLRGDQEVRQQTANQVVGAFKTYGFVYLVNHGISQEDTNALFDWSKRFFNLPEEVRMSPAVLRPEAVPGQKVFINRGYAPVGREKLSQAVGNDGELETLRTVPDAKEMFEMGPEKGVGQDREPNRYPPKDALPGFEDFTNTFFRDAHELGMEILRCIATGLGLEEDYFVDYHQEADDLFRLIRYPPVQRAAMLAGTTARTTPHTDYGSITILFQDNVGGLEVEDPVQPGTYIKATPVEGSVIVNIADFLMRWTNDTLKSNLHRVVEPPADRELPDGKELTKERFSIPFFVQADRSKVIQCAKGLEGAGVKYPPVSAGGYLSMRVGAAFKTF